MDDREQFLDSAGGLNGGRERPGAFSIRRRHGRVRPVDQPAGRQGHLPRWAGCTCWFWPTEEQEHAPLPSTLAEPPEATRAVAVRLGAEKRFFHDDRWHPERETLELATAGAAKVLGDDHRATKALARASITLSPADLWQARLAVKNLRPDQREAIVAAAEV